MRSQPKLADIADQAGVSVAAVSLALNRPDSPRVSPATRKRILAIAEQMHYTPNKLARALAERRSRLIGLVVPMRDPIFFNHFIANALSGIQKVLALHGYNLLIFTARGESGRPAQREILESRYTDGLIFINTRSCTTKDVKETIRQLENAQIHYAMINSYYGKENLNYVGVNDRAIGKAAAEYLLQKGHTRIAFLGGSPQVPSHGQLLKGLREGMRKAGAELPGNWVGNTEYDNSRARSILKTWLSGRQRPSAIFAADDQLTVSIYDFAEEAKLNIPGDVAVLRRSNAGIDLHLRPRPTSIVIPTIEIGEKAAELLIRDIESHSFKPSPHILSFTLVEAGSV